MKTIILLVLVTFGVHSAVVRAPTGKANLNAGYISTGDRLLHRSYVYRAAIANTIQYENVSYIGNRTTRISAVQAGEIGFTQYASVWIMYGGITQNNVTVKFQSSYGRGYYYLLSIWGQ